jgi:hypothetical protein
MFSRGAVAASLLALFALALSDAGAAQSAGRGKLALGKTSQGRGMGVRVDERVVRMLDFNAVLRCRDGSELIVEEGGFLPIRTRRNGTFRDVQYGRTDTVWLRGRVAGKWVRGQLRVTDRWGPVKCNSRWFRFAARLR